MVTCRGFHCLAMIVVAFAVSFLGAPTAGANSGMSMPGMQHDAPRETFAFGEPGKATNADRVVRIAMLDGRFVPVFLEVKVGETIRFVVTNEGVLDHDFTLGDAKTQEAHRKEMAEMAASGGEMHHGDDPNAVFVTPGQTRTLTWKFTRSGSLEFDCNVPGHYEAGMAGKISVIAKPK